MPSIGDSDREPVRSTDDTFLAEPQRGRGSPGLQPLPAEINSQRQLGIYLLQTPNVVRAGELIPEVEGTRPWGPRGKGFLSVSKGPKPPIQL